MRVSFVGKVASNAGAQALGLSHVDDFASRVLVEVHAGTGRQLSYFLSDVHGKERVENALHPYRYT
jgi:hypothetical protein